MAKGIGLNQRFLKHCQYFLHVRTFAAHGKQDNHPDAPKKVKRVLLHNFFKICSGSGDLDNLQTGQAVVLR